ncbi:MAG: zinc-dependent metalloprotease [Deltaproteobacteria bacterium]|nr:zinc-dependent metalloprotease [Deltaproteobacteria bacterium]
MKLFGLGILVVAYGLQILTSCGSERNPSDEPSGSHPFIIPKTREKEQTLAIQRSYLNKEFLLRTNVLSGGSTVFFSGLKSRIIRFQQEGKQLFLIESSNEYQLHDEFEQSFILARFPIIEESDASISFDFNKGMNQVYVQRDWDFNHHGELATEESFEARELTMSFLKSIVQDADGLDIQQVAQVREEGRNHPVEIRYHLDPYKPNPNFQPLASDAQKHFGFFKVHAQRAARGLKTWVAKFDISKPVIFYLTSNTPEEYRQTITEGVLYWNKAFGKDILQVKIAPKGVTAPNYQMNLIQWVDWDEARLAYADAQMDPRTGEVLNSQIYIPSAFSVGTKKQAVALLDEAERSSGPDRDLYSPQTFWEQGRLHALLRGDDSGTNGKLMAGHCFHEDRTALERAAMLSQVGDDKQIARLAHDDLRKTIAHEVGHVLGLRHNFAGNLAANFGAKDRQATFQRYLDGNTGGTVVTSSVMDYLALKESVIAGSLLKTESKANVYDEQAIQGLYFGANYSRSGLALFCTDEDVGAFIDCNRWRTGENAFTHAAQSADEFIHAFPFMMSRYILEQFRTSELGVSEPAGRVKFPDTYPLAARVLRERWLALESVRKGTRRLSIARHPGATSLSAEEIEMINALTTFSELKNVGGWKKALAALAPNFVDTATAKTKRILEVQGQELVAEGLLPSVHWEDLDKSIENFYRTFVQAFNELAVVQLALLPDISDVPLNQRGDTLADEFVPFLTSQVKDVLFATEGEDIVRGIYSLELSVPKNEKLTQLDNAMLKLKTDEFLTLDAAKEKAKEAILTILAKESEKETPASVEQPEDKKEPSDDSEGAKKDSEPQDAETKKVEEQQILHLYVPVDFKLKRFKYSQEVRKIATLILSKTPERMAQTFRERGILSMVMKSSLSEDFYGLDPEKMPMILQPRALSKWVSDIEQILMALRGLKQEHPK